ncbi:hypothetical protein Tco_1269516, partial [Tanacetum coccineum]
VKQQPDGIFISQDKYVADILKKFDFCSIKIATTPIASNKPIVKDKDGVDVDVHVYKSMIGSLMCLTTSRSMIASHLNAKLSQAVIKEAPTLTGNQQQAEYVAAANYFGQFLWIQNQMMDYGFNFMNTKIHIDNDSTICIVKNPVYHSRTKHIEIRHHFIRDCYEKRLIDVIKIHTDANVADLLTKGFDVTRFNFLVMDVKRYVMLFGLRIKVYFLASSSIHHALTVSLPIYTSYIEQFWNTATSQTVNDVKQINAIVNSKAVVVIEASIRSSLLFNDADGTACLTNEAIFQNLALIGYEGDFNKLNFQKALFSPQWKFLIHTILHCLSSKSTSWNEFSTNIASAVICLATNQKFNFSKLIFDGMLRNLDNTKKKFLMYPRFLMVFLNNQIELGEPFNDVYPTPAQNLKVFTNMYRKRLKFSGKITPLFPNMLTHAVEGEGSGEPTEPQPTPSLTQPSTGDQPPETSTSHATTQDSRDSLEGTNENEGDQVQTPHDSPLTVAPQVESIKDAQAVEISALKSRIKKLEKKCRPSISHHRAWLKSGSNKSGKRLSMKNRFGKKESVSKHGRKKSKPESTLDDNTVFDDQDANHGMEYMETKEAVDEGRKCGETKEVKLTDDTEVVEDKGSGDKGGNTEELVSTVEDKGSVEPRTPPITTRIFDDEDITMAQTLIKMKEEKAKEKGVSIKDVDDSLRPARSILTLKPLPTIDHKDKGKGVLKESPIKKVKRSDLDAAQIAKDAEIARLVHEKELAEMEREREERQRQDQSSVDYIASLYDEVQANMDASEELAARLQMEERERRKYRHNQLNKKTFEEIQALYINKQERDADFVKQLEGREENIRKRSGRRLEMKATKKSKRQKTDSDLKEEEQLRASLKIVPDEEEEVDYDVLGTRLLTGNLHFIILIDMEYLMTITEGLELMEVQDISRLSLKWFQDLIDWTSLSYIV